MVKLYVEGGGDASATKTACRMGFTSFLAKAGIPRKPRVVACGSRRNAYESFCTAVANGEDAMLLVDSEAPIASEPSHGNRQEWRPWQHLKQHPGDNWNRPSGSRDIDCHFMVQCMEAWFLADPTTIERFFGQGFRAAALPARPKGIEPVAKTSVYEGLANATSACKTKGRYDKGQHSFELLAQIEPEKVSAASPWAKRFLDALKDQRN